ncbi:MAG: hypothetical protein KGJ43_06450, partial [Acidobacteriota bacterium]|nr:hypothetical protein [Acidobacteriota bacterium]
MSPARARSLPERVREACAAVAAQAQHVTVAELEAGRYAATLEPMRAAGHGACHDDAAVTAAAAGDRELAAARVICLNAVNFGSGWWPTIRKLPGGSGYDTIAAGLDGRFAGHGHWSARQLQELTAESLARALGQEPAHPLISRYLTSLSDVGAHVEREYGCSFAAVVESAGGSVVRLADTLGSWDAYADVSRYHGRDVPLYKRAQLAGAEARAAGLLPGADVGALTAFADNLVPHVLWIDGVLRIDRALRRSIDAGDLLEHGSPEEVELRACTVHAVELLADALGRRRVPAQIDELLWHRGRGA